MSQQTVLRNKPQIKEATLDLLEGTAFGGALVAADFVDKEMGWDQESFKSAASIVPMATAGAAYVANMLTKGGAQKASRDACLMSTPVAILQFSRIARKKNLFGKIFKKKANGVSDHFRSNEHQKSGDTHQSASGLADVSMSSIDMLG